MNLWLTARKKPIIIHFREVDPDGENICTLEGILEAKHGRDFIIKGIEGEEYPIRKDIFYQTYEIVPLCQTCKKSRTCDWVLPQIEPEHLCCEYEQ